MPTSTARVSNIATGALLLLAAPLLLLAPAVPARAAPLYSAPYHSYETGAGPHSVASGDLDGDGRADLVTANANSHTVSVLLGRGDGTFGAKADFATGTSPRSVVIADLDGDGRRDLATANNHSSTVSVLIGNGDGTFRARIDFATGNGPRSVATADLDGDGRLDLTTANGHSNTVSALFGNGDGTFGAPAELDGGIYPTGVAIGDLDSDGWLDLAVANIGSDPNDPFDSGVSVLLGNGDGTFAPRTEYLTGGLPIAVAVGDLDANGSLDVAIANNRYGNSSVLLLLGNGDGTLKPLTQHRTASGPWSMIVADFNADGRMDMATANADDDPDFYQPTISILLGLGGGTFASRIDIPAGEYPVALAAADLDADGRVDLAVANNYGPGAVSVLLGNGDGSFGTTARFATGGGPRCVVAADLDSDGRSDLATANYSGTVSVLLGNGDGSLGAPADFGVGSDPHSLAVADLNADGRPDVAAANYLSASVSVLLGKGDGTFGAKTDFGTGGGPNSLAIGDLNGDGHPDLAVANHNYDPGNVSILLGNGDGTFGPKTDFGTGAAPHSLAIADLNADGRPDLAVTGYGARMVSVLLGVGDGTFGPRSDFAVGVGPGPLGVADLNADGRADLVVANTNPPTISVLLGNGDGTFGPRTDFDSGSEPASLALADFDGDGRTDVVLVGGSWNMGAASVLLGNGDGSFGNRVAFGCGPGPSSVAIGDLNVDGRWDLVVANMDFSPGTVSVLLGRSDLPTAVRMSLASVEATLEGVTLRWWGEGAALLAATVQRRAPAGEWELLGSPIAEGADLLRFEDRAVTAGGRYGYRLSYRDGGGESFTPEIVVDVPVGHGLSLEGFRPNPAVGAPVLMFTLPDASPATIEVIDAAGRRVLEREVVGAGRRTIRLDGGARLTPGIYLLRLRQAGRVRIARGVVIE